MNPKHYHTPISAGPQRRRCPVCHQSVYSQAGIHPQCAMKQAEPPRASVKKPTAPSETPLTVASPTTETPETAAS